MQPRLSVKVLPRESEVVLYCVESYGCLAEGVVVGFPYLGSRCVGHDLRGAEMVDVVVVNADVVVDSGQGPAVQPDVDFGVAAGVFFVEQFAVGAVVKGGGQAVLVDLFDALAQRVVGVGGDLGGGGTADEAVEAVVAEGGGAAAGSVAVGGFAEGVAAFLIQPVAACGAVNVGQYAGVAGLALAVAVFVVAVAQGAEAACRAVDGGDEAAGGVVGVGKPTITYVVEVFKVAGLVIVSKLGTRAVAADPGTIILIPSLRIVLRIAIAKALRASKGIAVDKITGQHDHGGAALGLGGNLVDAALGVVPISDTAAGGVGGLGGSPIGVVKILAVKPAHVRNGFEFIGEASLRVVGEIQMEAAVQLNVAQAAFAASNSRASRSTAASAARGPGSTPARSSNCRGCTATRRAS